MKSSAQIFFNMIWSIEMKYNAVFIYDTYTYDMYDYYIKYNI